MTFVGREESTPLACDEGYLSAGGVMSWRLLLRNRDPLPLDPVFDLFQVAPARGRSLVFAAGAVACGGGLHSHLERVVGVGEDNHGGGVVAGLGQAQPLAGGGHIGR
ncbi:MAG: hypothetical protein AAF481_09390 [Acidobacteriota bacterium]